MEFVSLGSIIYDILNIIRGAEITDDEPITEKQVEAWVHQYRALLIKRDIDKGKYINPDYVQNIDSISLEYDSTRQLYRTSSDIPETIDFNRQSGITYVGDVYGNRIQLMSETRIPYQKHTRYTQDDTVAFLRGHRVYLSNSHGLSTVSIRGIFQVPPDAAILAGETYTYDSYYPIPINMVTTLKQEILKNELNIEYQVPNDEINNSDHEIEDVLQQRQE